MHLMYAANASVSERQERKIHGRSEASRSLTREVACSCELCSVSFLTLPTLLSRLWHLAMRLLVLLLYCRIFKNMITSWEQHYVYQLYAKMIIISFIMFYSFLNNYDCYFS